MSLRNGCRVATLLTSLSLLLSLALLSGCPPSSRRTQRSANVEVRILSFAETDGMLKDCGCHVNPTGGLARRATLIDSLRDAHVPFLLIDAGNFMNEERSVSEFKSRFIWREMKKMGYDVSCPGIREISGWKVYHAMSASGPIKSVATNLTVWEDGKSSPAGLRYAVVTVRGVKVGVFSLIGSDELKRATPPPGIRFEASDPLATARTMVPELRDKVDLMVLASQMSADQTNQVIEQVPGIDVAIYGRQPPWIESPRSLVGTITQRTGTGGEYVGDLVLVVDPTGRIVEWHSQNAPLGSRFPEQPKLAARVKQVEAKAGEMTTYGRP